MGARETRHVFLVPLAVLSLVAVLALLGMFGRTSAAANRASAAGELSGITILSANGICTYSDPSRLADGSTACEAALYGSSGFSGVVTYDASDVGTLAHLVAYVCGARVGSTVSEPVTGTYRVTISGSGLSPVSKDIIVTSSAQCANGSGDSQSPFAVADAVTFVVPSDALVSYTLALQGTTAATAHVRFAAFASIRVQATDLEDTDEGDQDSQVESPTVPPPPPPPVIAEAQVPAALLVSGAVVLLWLSLRRTSSLVPARRR
jgi:hypothetical protein